MAPSVRIRPGVGLLSLFPAMNYKPWFALGEFVDNSIQSYLDNRDRLRSLHGPDYRLRIDIDFSSGANPEILIADNAAGIAAIDLDRAFTPAARPPDRTGISQYGIGMKSAATWYADFYTVRSAALGEEVSRFVVFDIPEIVANETEELPIEEEAKPPNEHGTRILLRRLHQGVPSGRTLGKIRAYIASIYRDFIRSGEVVITVGGEVLSYTQPGILTAQYWPTDKGPDSAGATREWLTPIDIELGDSWEADSSPGRPDRPPRIRGWMAILATGSTKQSGAALLWRRKVVVGAGTMAQGDEDSYRPATVFGAPNSFPFQRLFGELDVSELQVTTFKDQIDWRPGQEEEFQRKLKEELEVGAEPTLRMSRNFRSTIKTEESKSTVEQSLRGTTIAAKDAFEASLEGADLAAVQDLDEGVEASEVEAQERIVSVDGGGALRFEIVLAPGDSQWLRLKLQGSEWVLQLNRTHPFMESFANVPGADLDPVFRLAVAIALAEVKARTSGHPHPQLFRMFLNDALTGSLASRMDVSADGDSP